MAFNLLYLSKVLDKPKYKKICRTYDLFIKKCNNKTPNFFRKLGLFNSVNGLENTNEIVIVGKNYQEKLNELIKTYHPFKVITICN